MIVSHPMPAKAASMSVLSRRAGLALSLLALLIAPTAALRAQTPAPTPAAASAGPSVTVIPARRTEIVQSVVVSGSMVARDEVLVSPEVDGLAIVELAAEEGDRVAAGQVLARLSRVTLEVQKTQNEAQQQRAEAGISQARAQIAEAQANLVQAQNAFERTKTLRDSGNASVEQFDLRASAARGAEARLNAANQALAIATADLAVIRSQGRDLAVKLERTEIKAPAAGLISRRNARLGAIVAMAAAEPLFRIIADGAIELEADIAEVELPRISVGQPVAVTPAGSTTALAGKIRLISPEVNRQSRLGRVRVALDGNPQVALGSFARGVIETGRKTALTLPLSAITYARSGATVQRVVDNRVETVKVELGLLGDGRAEIASGLDEGAVVVARAGTFVRDGDIITPVPTN